eukprot:g5614.t1
MDLHTFDQICAHLHDPSKRAVMEEHLRELGDAADALDRCRAFLEATSEPGSQFHAATILGSTALKRWAGFPPDAQAQLRLFFLSFVLERAAALPAFVRAKLLQMFAVLWKRATLEDADGYAGAFEHVKQLVASDDVAPQLVGLHALNALVEEYSTSRSTALGLPLEFHREARLRFERSLLPEVFALSLARLQAVVGSLQQQQQQQQQQQDDTGQLIHACLRLSVEVLNWTFGIEGAMATSSMNSLCAGLSPGPTMFRPGPSWRGVLVESEILPLAFSMYEVVRTSSSGGGGGSSGDSGGGGGSSGNSELAHLARQMLIQLASVSGNVYASDAQRATTCRSLFVAIMHGIVAKYHGHLLAAGEAAAAAASASAAAAAASAGGAAAAAAAAAAGGGGGCTRRRSWWRRPRTN